MPHTILSNIGSVDDIRSTLRFYTNGTHEQLSDWIWTLTISKVYESKQQNRATVIKMFETKLKQLHRELAQLPPLPPNDH